jgi:ribonuclease HI
MTWVKRTLRGTTVWALAREGGELDAGPDGRVDVKYKLDDAAKVYRAAARNLGPPADDGAPAVAPRTHAPAVARADAIVVYTDGACTGNPGPMGVGVVILRGGRREEISEFLGEGTNNIAELTAIERALDALAPAEREHPVLVHVDSAYAIGVVSGAYKAKKNLELVARLRAKAGRFPHLRFVKVAGHAGVAENERCDQLATQAIARRGPRG